MRKQFKVFIGSDHAGFKLKEIIKKYLDRCGYEVEDLGNHYLDQNDDYPDFAKKVALAVAKGKGLGILICDSGVGVCIVANKIKGVRAVNAYNLKIAKASREHNHTNVLCLGQKYLTVNLAKRIVRTWLNSSFDLAPRHCRRVDKIKKIEQGNL